MEHFMKDFSQVFVFSWRNGNQLARTSVVWKDFKGVICCMYSVLYDTKRSEVLLNKNKEYKFYQNYSFVECDTV
jgi:hypothetical protein